MNDNPDSSPEVAPFTAEQIKNISEFTIGGPEFAEGASVAIPDEAVQKWVAIPTEQKVAVPLTRQDLDRFYFAFTQLNAASTMLANAMRQLSVGDTPGANAAFGKGLEFIRSSDGNFRKFFTSIMLGAQPYE